MTQENLEEKTSKTEETESTQTEETKSTETGEKSTASEKKYDQKELDTAVGKGVSTLQSQLSISKAEAETVKAELDLSKSLQEDTEKRMTELEALQFADDPGALKGFRLTKSLEVRERKANLRDKVQEKRDKEQDARHWAITMAEKAAELLGQYQVPKEALELCTSEEQMEKIAKAFPEVGEKPGGKTPKFAGPGAGGVGKDPNKMTADEQLKEGFKQVNK